MLSNGIKQTTETTGTGNLTLVAGTGIPKFSDAFGLNIPFNYTLLNGSGLFVEAGIGHLSDATTLVRERISATFVGGIYNASNPSAANLSGTTTIVGTPHAATLESMLPTVDKTTVGINRYLMTAGRTSTVTNQNLAALRVYYVPFLLRTGTPITSLMANVTTAGVAGSVLRIGIYSCNESGYMGALLFSSGDLDGASTGTRSYSLPAPAFLPPGWYFVAIVCSAAISVTAQTTGAGTQLGGGPFGFNGSLAPIDMHYENVASAVLPVVANAVTTPLAQNTHNPVIYVGV